MDVVDLNWREIKSKAVQNKYIEKADMARTKTKPGPKPKYGEREEIHVFIPKDDLGYIRSVSSRVTEWVIQAIQEKRQRDCKLWYEENMTLKAEKFQWMCDVRRLTKWKMSGHTIEEEGEYRDAADLLTLYATVRTKRTQKKMG
jgi:hypothetical protein